MSAPPKERRNARIVMTTLLLTEQITQEDHGSEGNYVLYGSSCAQITEEAEYVKKQLPQAAGDKAESKSSGWSCSPVARTVKETEEQLLVVSRENQALKIKLEATREAGVQALRSASQQLRENYRTRSEELKKSHENEKQQIQEKKTLIEKKMAFEKTLQEMMSRNEDSKRCLDLQRQISTLREQILHLQRVIQAQHRDLRGVIREAEELNNELSNQDKKIENLTGKLTALEAQNKELKDRVEFWSSQPKANASKALQTDAPRDFGAFGASPYLMLTRLRKHES
ncbi:coiled-coil domain-containing protein 68 isoform X4 [Grus americana]|uniref:coiled-coil domain-containing protein 68 isoform X4 n=1 Tax=Grus americana TaxID=9117 RepID=UPI0024082A24|nr:coiled-coil domain-containing protein 68 isoform X4 [Grus americana]